MKLNVRYKKPLEEPYECEVELKKNNKGYNIQIDGNTKQLIFLKVQILIKLIANLDQTITIV